MFNNTSNSPSPSTIHPIEGKRGNDSSRPLNPRFKPLVIEVNALARGSINSLDQLSGVSNQIESLKNKNEFLKSTHNPKFLFQKDLKPTPEEKIEELTKEGTEDLVILWRGCTSAQLLAIAEKGTAGGLDSQSNTPTPTEKSAKEQVGEIGKLPEFTTSPTVAQGFGTGTFVAAFKISTKFLTRGSISESGWVCNPSAKVELLAWDRGRLFVPISSPTTSPLTPRASPQTRKAD